jgi:hypothetical protein
MESNYCNYSDGQPITRNRSILVYFVLVEKVALALLSFVHYLLTSSLPCYEVIILYTEIK